MVNNFARITGGADLHCLELTEGLRDRGHEVRWLATRSQDNLETSGEFVPYAVEAGTREDLGPRQRLRAARWALWNPHAAAAMERLIREYRPDVVHVHKAYVQLSVAPVVVASRNSVPVVQTAHDFEFVSASMVDPDGGLWDRDESRLSYRALNSATMLARRYVHRPRVDQWIAVSADLARAYRDSAGIEATVVPNFTEPSQVDPVPFEQRSGVVFIGRLAEEKGLEHVIEAARLAPELPFTIAGGGPLAGRVQAAASALPNLEYAGRLEHSQGRALLAGARICAMPSLWREPGSLVGLEAMSEGTPVVTYRKGGLAEYVENAGAGAFSDPEDARGLADALTSLYPDQGTWQRLSAGGREAAGAVHSLPSYLDSLERIYASLAPGARPAPMAAG
jgi:glycosyltransferase involved in cell wall biosynthesis